MDYPLAFFPFYVKFSATGEGPQAQQDIRDMVEARRSLEAGNQFGKIVVTV
ncbi:hypothetical protein GJ700_18995 [Duganella sp. FT92W]|uniref:Uncharacterized protein n=1 Tax=Pseudoduganella rivuli TaxID=2666085 RepID=A0A7X2LV85_9BURK|nr:hypothetical protein [Pseudoduganella rivuli]MRV73802.1 hypothetical protein [Pseudoduganella rivuli]